MSFKNTPIPHTDLSLCYSIVKTPALSCGTVIRLTSDVLLEAIGIWWLGCQQIAVRTWLVSDQWHHLKWCCRHGPAVSIGSQRSTIILFVGTGGGKCLENRTCTCVCPTNSGVHGLEGMPLTIKSQSWWLAKLEGHRREPKPKPITLNIEFNVCLGGVVKCSLHFSISTLIS